MGMGSYHGDGIISKGGCTVPWEGNLTMKTKPYYRNWIIPYHESNFPYKIQMWIKIHSITPKSPQTSHSWTALIVCQENQNQEICRDMKRSVHISLSPFLGGKWLSNHLYWIMRMITMMSVDEKDHSDYYWQGWLLWRKWSILANILWDNLMLYIKQSIMAVIQR